jgi:hypothetical protein
MTDLIRKMKTKTKRRGTRLQEKRGLQKNSCG